MFIFQVVPKRFVRFSPRNLFMVDYQVSFLPGKPLRCERTVFHTLE